MSSSQHDALAWEQACRTAARRLVARFGWRAVAEEELVAAMTGDLPEGAPNDPDRLAFFYCSCKLYASCLPAGDAQGRELAFADVHSFLVRIARRRWPDLAEDVTQRALLLVVGQIETCRKPGAFLAFAAQKLRHAASTVLEGSSSDPPLDLSVQRELADDASLLATLESAEGLRMLLAALARLPDREREAVFQKYFEERSDEAIAGPLGVKVDYVRVLRHRGLARLRKDPALRAYFLGLGEPGV